jgi:predicted DNA-binding transcriptional regulator AlpA
MMHYVALGPRYVTAPELARLLGMTKQRLYQLVKAGRLTPAVAKPIRFAYDDAVRWVQERRDVAARHQRPTPPHKEPV